MATPSELADKAARREDGVIELSESAFQDFLRDVPDAPREEPDEKKEEAPREERHEEPEIKVEGEEGPGERIGETIPSDDEGGETDLKKALSTISRLESEMAELKQRPRDTERRERPEPSPLVEVAPGVRLPQDRNLWPVQLTDDLVKGIGLDPGDRADGKNKGQITEGLEILGNLLVTEIVTRIMPTFVEDHLSRRESVRENTEKERETFFGTFSDLKDKGDLMEIVEGRLQREVQAGTRKYVKREDYLNDLARETRTRVASLRGETYDEYIQRVGARRSTDGGGSQRPSGRSRATTTTGGRAGRPKGDNSKSDMDDMIDNA